MALIKWNPVRSTSGISEWLDDFFDDRMGPGTSRGRSLPPVNVLDLEDRFELQLAAPGLEKEDFDIRVENNMLLIEAEREEERKEEEEHFSRREFNYRSFRRQFTLPDEAKEDAIKASYRDGILTIGIPKKKGSLSKRPKQISVR
jgi:HSP20 family protein